MMTVEYIGIRPSLASVSLISVSLTAVSLPIAIGIIISSSILLGFGQAQEATAEQLLVEFHSARYFWQQQQVAVKIVALGDSSVLAKLMEALDSERADLVVIAIQLLRSIGAHNALPRLRELREDRRRTTFGKIQMVGEAAREAITAMPKQ